MKKIPSIRIGGVPEHFNLPWHLAMESGAFADAGVPVAYTDYPEGTGKLAQALRTQELDMAIVLTEGMVADILKGNPSKIVKIHVESPLIWGIHVAADGPISALEDMRTSRYAISRFGSGSHLMAMVDAVQRGWKAKALRFETIHTLDGARKALREGEADVFFWEKYMTQPYVDSGEFRRIGEVLTLWPSFMVAVRNDVLEAHPEAIKSILHTINQSCDQLMHAPDAVSLIARRFDLKESDVGQWLQRTRWNTSLELPAHVFDNVVSALLQAGIISQLPQTTQGLFHDWNAHS